MRGRPGKHPVVWARPARRCEPTLGAVVEALCDLALAQPPEENGTFAVRASVAGEDRTFTGSDVERVGETEGAD